MVLIIVEYIEKFLTDDAVLHETEAPTKFEIETHITNVRELKAYLAFNLNIPVQLPPQEQILEHDDNLLLDEDTKLDTLERNWPGDVLHIYMYRKLPKHMVELYVEMGSGISSKQKGIDISTTTDVTVADLKNIIHVATHVPQDKQLLRTKGVIMEDNCTLGDYLVNLLQEIVLERVEDDAQKNEEAAAEDKEAAKDNEEAAAQDNDTAKDNEETVAEDNDEANS